MAQFQNMIITRAGLDMIAQSQAGGTLIFTKGKLGDGQIGDQSIPDLTDLINAKMSVELSSVTAKTEGHVEVRFIVDNTDLDVGFFVREVGIFAKVNDEGVEKLYGYANAGNYTNYLADKTVPIDSIITKIDLVVGNASNVAFTTDKSIVYVTLEDMENALNTHDAGADAHEPAFAAHNASDDAHKDFTGATAETAGKRGMVPAPAAGENNKFLRGDGTWADAKMSTKELVDILYPVGHIYMSTNSANPETLFPGTTWEAYAQGRVLIGAGTGTDSRSEKKTFTAGSTGGEYNHQLTVGEIAQHSHTGTITATNLTGSVKYTACGGGGFWSDAHSGVLTVGSQNRSAHADSSGADDGLYHSIELKGSHSHGVTVSNAGGNEAHLNMQPYITCYIWQRTA